MAKRSVQSNFQLWFGEKDNSIPNLNPQIKKGLGHEDILSVIYWDV
jgi:hypothetical protein